MRRSLVRSWCDPVIAPLVRTMLVLVFFLLLAADGPPSRRGIFLVDGFSIVRGPAITSHSTKSTTTATSKPLERRTSAQGKRPPTLSSSRIGSKLSASSSSSSDPSSNDNNYDEICDVLVLGSGPAGRAVASLLHAAGKDVILADQNADRPFPPNYGVWEDEWEAVLAQYSGAEAGAVDLTGGRQGQAIDFRWNVTDCFFGGSFDVPTEERTRIDRPYLRVDRHALRSSLTNGYRQLKANHISTCLAPNVYTPAGSLRHDATGSTIQLRQSAADGDGALLLRVRATLIVDTTGHETDLVLRESQRRRQPAPGYQIAYGFLVDVEGPGVTDKQIGPYARQAMTLFDYRTDHYDDDDNEAQRDKVVRAPTFMYAMPLQGDQIFFEETSLVARPAISFQECKDRCLRRLEHLGIRVTKLHEEEFCYIPMGGALPAKDQRVLALGGAAAMVHPSTGYHLCRCLMGASDLSAVVLKELASTKDGGKQPPNLDRTAAAAYHALWSPSNIRQRNFAVFGGEYLMKQDVVGLRGFFGGFFRLPLPLWAGFLAGWPGLPNNERHETWWARMWFGLNFVARLPPSVAVDMIASIVGYIAFTDLALAQSVTPFLGEPESYEYKPNTDNRGDVAAKVEARRMILESKVVEDLPVDFEANDGAATTIFAEEAAPPPLEPFPELSTGETAESVKVPRSVDFQ